MITADEARELAHYQAKSCLHSAEEVIIEAAKKGNNWVHLTGYPWNSDDVAGEYVRKELEKSGFDVKYRTGYLFPFTTVNW